MNVGTWLTRSNFELGSYVIFVGCLLVWASSYVFPTKAFLDTAAGMHLVWIILFSHDSLLHFLDKHDVWVTEQS